ncbi:MAG: amidohydrolase family protein [Clostridiales Family XIII bacterium]|jgi:imidazolonepropionase-like amidohydrolase|nr:amidohydrolase family protein [Clostridiales Family XIII bacterium]
MLHIKNAKIYTMAGDVIEKGDILADGGKIIQVAESIEAPGAEVIDAEGLCALPGFVDAHSHIGGLDTATGNMELNEVTDPVIPNMQAIYGVDVSDANFKSALAAGITTACICPGSLNVISGQAFAAKTYGKDIHEMVLKDPCALKLALGGNPKRSWAARFMAPMTRMAVAHLIRSTFRAAQDYLAAKEAAGDDKAKQPPFDPKSEAILPALRGEIPLKFHCEQFDIVTAIEIAKEFGCNYSIDHAWDACDYYDELESGGGTVMFGPIGIPVGLGEARGADIFCVKELVERGLNVTLITDAPAYACDILLIQAGEAVRWGTPHEDALRMLTINGAKALGLADRIGSIEAGKDADITLFKGVPAIDVGAQLQCTIVNGEIAWKRGGLS